VREKESDPRGGIAVREGHSAIHSYSFLQHCLGQFNCNNRDRL